MSLSLKRPLIYISLFLISLSGCRQSSFMPVGMVELPEIRFPVDEEVEKMSYKMDLEAQRGTFSGILVIKRMAKDIRLAFFSEVGMSYLEASLEGPYPYNLHIRSVHPLVSSPKTLENLESVLNLLLAGKKDLQEGGVYRDEKNSYWIKGLAEDGARYWGRIDDRGHIDHAFSSGREHLKAIFDYSPSAEGLPVQVHYKDRKENVIILLKYIPE